MICRLLCVVCLSCLYLLPTSLHCQEIENAELVFPPDEPRLSIVTAGGELLLSWPAWAGDWVLEQSVGLRPGTPWARVSPTLYRTNATANYAQVSALDGNRFYRLRRIGPAVAGQSAYWQLDEGIGATSESLASVASPLVASNTAWVAGRFGPTALHFNGLPANAGGSRAWADNAGHRLVPASGAFSISFWLSPDGWTNGWRGLAGNDTTGTNGWHLALHTPTLGTNYLVFAAAGAANSLSITGQTLLLPGQWREVTITYDGLEGTIYLDSNLLARGPGALPNHDGQLFFGGGVRAYDSFWGRIDDIRVHTNALVREEISLAGHWRFNENTGRFAADAGVRGRHATISDTAAWQPGREGAGIDLSAGSVVIHNSQFEVLPPSGGAFSISCWIRPDALPEGRGGLMSCGNGSTDGWHLAVTKDVVSTMLHFVSTNHGGTLNFSAPAPLTDSVWTKLDVTYNGGVATIYANGRKLGSRNGAIRGTRAPLIVGTAPGAENFSGTIDDLKIYNRERDAAEIGPVALTMWETVIWNSSTNFVLQGFGPPGKPLTFSIVDTILPTNGTISHAAGSSIVAYHGGSRKGPDAFAYTVSDGEFTSEPAIVTMSVVQPHWLSPAGGPVEPRDGSSPDRAWLAGPATALDGIWRTNNYYDAFFYAPGDYETTGWKYVERPTANPGCKHIGSGNTGLNRTTIRLVNTWDAWGEGMIFAIRYRSALCDGFETHNMELDCNAANNPKYVLGEPTWLRIPLATPSYVDSVILRWGQGSLVPNFFSRLGRAAEFDLCLVTHIGSASITNCRSFSSTGTVDVIPVDAMADELIVNLRERYTGVDMYCLTEIEISGAQASLPSATRPDGLPDHVNENYSIVSVADGDPGTFWISESTNQVQILLPLAPGTALTGLDLQWKCRTIDGLGRAGPAATYRIRARNSSTGEFEDVPIVRHGLTTMAIETVSFGSSATTNAVISDAFMLVLETPELGVSHYSLAEIKLRNGRAPMSLRLPTARSSFGGNNGVLRAFDGNPATRWVSGTQGMLGAFDVSGNNMKFTNLRVRGFGTKAGREDFVMFVYGGDWPGRPTQLGNVLIEDCVFTEPATGNTDGLTVIGMGANPPDILTNAVVRRCAVTDVRPYFSYSHAFAAIHVENCLVRNCGQAVYFEPDAAAVDDIGPVLIRSNQFVNVNNGVFVVSHPQAQFDSLTILNNEIVLGGYAGHGIGACDVCDAGPSGSITNVTAINNIMRYPDWQPRPYSPDRGIFYTDMQHGIFANNIVALGNQSSLRVRQCPAGVIYPPNPTEDCEGNISGPSGSITYPPCLDVLPPGYRRAWMNNRDISGSLLEVKFNNNGVDGRSSQQQWPE